MEVDQRSDDFRKMTYRERLLRLRSQNVVAPDQDAREETETGTKFPRIVLKDSLGNRLNTFTLLQEALYRAEWNVKRSKEAKLPEEWRLPHAPLPARPDYSRATPSVFEPKFPKPQQRTNGAKVTPESSRDGKRFHEIDIDDVSFVKESLNHLPQVPSLAFLRQEFLRDRKDYLQIVGSILLHKRYLSETDKRESIYNFPGFCTGCQRSGLCYGCERSSEPHYHVDGLKLGEVYQLNANRGVGFLSEDKFTDNWRLRFPELARRSRGRDGSKISHDSQLFEDGRFRLGEDSRGGRKGFAIISDEKLPDLPGLGPFKYENDDQGSSERDPDRMDIYNQQDLLSDLEKLSRHGTHSEEGRGGTGGAGRGQERNGSDSHGERTGGNIVRLVSAGQDIGRDNDGDGRESQNNKSTTVSTSQKKDYDKDSSTQREKSDMSSGHYSQHTSRWTSGTEGYEEDDDDEDDTQKDSEATSSAQKRRRLYKAPQPFKLKQRKQRATQSRSPFSTNRKYDVPTGKPWSPKKSNKKLTEFVDFERKEVDWKEPKKFTLKDSDKGTTQFWSPPPSKDKDVKKKKTTRRKVQGPPPSPDSGLESEKVHGSTMDQYNEYKHTWRLAKMKVRPQEPKCLSRPSIGSDIPTLPESEAKTNTPRIRKHLPKQNFTMRLPTIPSPSPSSNTPSNISLSPILSISREASLDPTIRYRLPSPNRSKLISVENGNNSSAPRKSKDNIDVGGKVTGRKANGKRYYEKQSPSPVMRERKIIQEEKDLSVGSPERDYTNESQQNTYGKSPENAESSESLDNKMSKSQPAEEVKASDFTKQDKVKKSTAHAEGSGRSVQRLMKPQLQDVANASDGTGRTKARSVTEEDVPSPQEFHSANDDMDSLIISKYSDLGSSPTAVEQYGRNLSTRGSTRGSTRASVDSTEDPWLPLKENSSGIKGHQSRRRTNSSDDAGISGRSFKKNVGNYQRLNQENIRYRNYEGERSTRMKSRMGISSLEKVKEVDEHGMREQCRSVRSNSGQSYVGYRNYNDDHLGPKMKSVSPALSRNSTSLDIENKSISRFHGRQTYFKGRKSRTSKSSGHLDVNERKKSEAKSRIKHGKSHRKQKASVSTKQHKQKDTYINLDVCDSSTVIDSDRERRVSSSDDDYSPISESRRNKYFSERRSRRDKYLMESGKSETGKQEFKIDEKYDDYSMQMAGSKLPRKEVMSTDARAAKFNDKFPQGRSLANKAKGSDIMMYSKESPNKEKGLVNMPRSTMQSRRKTEMKEMSSPTSFRTAPDGEDSKRKKNLEAPHRPMVSLERDAVSRPIVLRTTSGAVSPIFYEPTFVSCPWAESDDESDGVPNRSLPKKEINIHIPKVDMSRRNSEMSTDVKQSNMETTAEKICLALEGLLSVQKKSIPSSEESDSIPVASVENASLTSVEPDLELSLDDVLDIEKLSELDVLDERQLRRKLRRQKKMANRANQDFKTHGEKDFNEETSSLPNSNEITEVKDTAYHVGNTRRKGDEEIDDTNGSNEHKTTEYSSPIPKEIPIKGNMKIEKSDEVLDNISKPQYNHSFAKEENIQRFSEKSRFVKSQCPETRINHKSSKGTKMSRTVSRKLLESNFGRIGNMETRGGKLKNSGGQTKRANVEERLYREKEKLTNEGLEIDFDDLPSVQSLLKKIMNVDQRHAESGQDGKQEKNQRKKSLTDSDSDAELDNGNLDFPEAVQTIPVINLEFHDMDEDGKDATGESHNNTHKRPRSASTENCFEKINSKILLRRTSSLPNIAFTIEQIVDKKEEPLCTPIILPKFPARFKPKKTKTLNPKRVPGRQRPISQEQTTSDKTDAENNQNLESENSLHNDEDSSIQDMLVVDDDEEEDDDEDDRQRVVPDVPRPSPSTPMNEQGNKNTEGEEIIDSVKEIPLKTSDLTDLERTASPLSPRGASPALKHGDLPSKRPVGISPIVEKPQKKEKVKKPKKEVKKPPTPIRSCSPHTPIPLDDEPVVALETQKIDVAPPALPELPPLELPPLPEYVEDKEKKEKKKVPHRVSIEPMPKLQEAPPPSKKSKPLQVPRSKPMQRKKSLMPAEAPVTVDEISHMKDPLDFLAKYCIISLDRLPYYEKVYNRVIASQPQRYEPPLSPISGLPIQPTKRKEKKKEKGEVTLHDMVSGTKGMEPFKVGLNVPEQYVEKLIYTIQICDEKHLDISERLRDLEIQKTMLLAEKAKQLNPDIAKVEFKLKKPKKKKKKKKSGAVEVEEPVVFSKKDITDEVIVARIDEKMMKKLMKEPDLHHIQCDMERCADRLATLEFRILQMENERNILDMYCTDLFFTEQLANERPVEFRRQQSNLYNKLHPDPDIDMNIEELESALHTINSTLLSENEFGYLFHVLNLAGRRKINFKLFSVIAALSEKISQMDPVIKDLLNKDDYNALDIKMERSKELFGLLDDGDTAMYGNALASNLAVELTAGGLTPEHTSYVMSKFNREGKGFIDFLDYVMYVPLFIEIHERIIRDPLNAKLVI